MDGVYSFDDFEAAIWRLYDGCKRPPKDAEYFYSADGWLRRRSDADWRSNTERDSMIVPKD